MTDVNKLLKTTLAGQIALKLDKRDGNSNNQISSSIWNEFVNSIGTGKNISEGSSISVVNAMNSITTYAIRVAKQSGKSVDGLAQEWLNTIDSDGNNSENTQNTSNDSKAQNSENKETINNNNLKETAYKGIYYDSETKTHFKRSGNNMVEIQAISGGRITQYLKDGSHIEKCNVSGKNYTLRKYDKNNKLIMKTDYENGKAIHTHKFDNVNETQEARYHKLGKTVKWGEIVKTFDNGDFVCWVSDDITGERGFHRYKKDCTPLYCCDKDGNKLD